MDEEVDTDAYSVSASNVLLSDGKELKVSVTYDGTLTESNGVEIPYKLVDSNGDITSGDVILTQTAGQPDAVPAVTFGAAVLEKAKYAGVYTDTATFVTDASEKTYTAEEIEADEHLYGIGWHEAKDVIAIFNEDFTEVVIRKNGDCPYSNGRMKNFTSPESSYNTNPSPMTDHSDTLRKFTIENGITNIGDCAFENCALLDDASIPNSITSIGSQTFADCGFETIFIPNSVTTIGNAAFIDCTFLKAISLSSNITEISSGLFRRCSSLESITIPNGVITIGSGAFAYCTGLTAIDIPESVESIADGDPLWPLQPGVGDGAFYGCSSLTNVTLGNNLKSIGAYAFSHCSSLSSITLGSKVENIGFCAFNNCNKLTNIYIPNSVISIDDDAFSFPEWLTLQGPTGSYAETWAAENGYTFIAQ